MPKSDLNKVALQLYIKRTSAWAFSYKFSTYFENTFSQEHLCVAASDTAKLQKACMTKLNIRIWKNTAYLTVFSSHENIYHEFYYHSCVFSPQ